MVWFLIVRNVHRSSIAFVLILYPDINLVLEGVGIHETSTKSEINGGLMVRRFWSVGGRAILDLAPTRFSISSLRGQEPHSWTDWVEGRFSSRLTLACS